MNIGLYFGSFNPIHTGHLIIADFVANNSGVDQVWFVVTPQNPFKKTTSLLNEYQRLYLVKLATEDNNRLQVSDIEFKLPRPSYTIDTLTHLEEKHPQHTFSIIVGSDSYQNISKWKNGHLLMEKYPFHVYLRPGFPVDSLTNKTTILTAPLLDISSTNIRKNLELGKPIKYLVSDAVIAEIEKGGYYR